MSPEELSEMEQLDALAAEVEEAGRAVRVSSANRERPEPAFSMSLRAQLLSEWPAESAGATGQAVAVLADTARYARPQPPVRPLDAPEQMHDRRHAGRPFGGPDRRWVDVSQPWSLDMPAPSRRNSSAADEVDSGLTDRGAVAAGAAGPAGAARTSIDLGAVSSDDPRDEADGGRVTALKPSMRWRIPTRVLPARWIAAGLAASVAVASLIYGSGVMWPVRSVATADEAVGATLVRGASTSPLEAGAELREGDEIKIANGGRATLQIGGDYVRMASEADIRLTSLDRNHVSLAQISGRVYHRVSVPNGGDYQVTTATVTWKAHGTSFDLNRHATAGGGEEVRALALFDGIDLDGPLLQATLAEGTSATVVLSADGSPSGSPVIEPITTMTLADEWLLANAGLDARLGLPLGRLSAFVTPVPSATAEPIVVPDEATEAPTTEPTATATPAATPVPTPIPTPRPTVKPTPTGPANLGVLHVTRNGDGSYSFSWPKYTGTGFQYYKLVHEPYGKTPSFPGSPYWVCNTSPGENTWSGLIDPGDYAVRLQVVDETSGKTVIRAQTGIIRLTVTTAPSLPPTANLGPLGVADNHDGTYTFSWAPYTGGSFNYYKLVYETTASGKAPSYPGGSPYWAVPGTGDTSIVLTLGVNYFLPGDYQVRIQAIGYPSGAYAYAQTTVLNLVVP
jgi:hypothetical protein